MDANAVNAVAYQSRYANKGQPYPLWVTFWIQCALPNVMLLSWLLSSRAEFEPLVRAFFVLAYLSHTAAAIRLVWRRSAFCPRSTASLAQAACVAWAFNSALLGLFLIF